MLHFPLKLYFFLYFSFDFSLYTKYGAHTLMTFFPSTQIAENTRAIQMLIHCSMHRFTGIMYMQADSKIKSDDFKKEKTEFISTFILHMESLCSLYTLYTFRHAIAFNDVPLSRDDFIM